MKNNKLVIFRNHISANLLRWKKSSPENNYVNNSITFEKQFAVVRNVDQSRRMKKGKNEGTSIINQTIFCYTSSPLPPSKGYHREYFTSLQKIYQVFVTGNIIPQYNEIKYVNEM